MPQGVDLESYFHVSDHEPVRLDGATIRALRKARGLTQRELAEALGVSETTIRHWEHNRRHPGSARRAIEVVQVLEPEAHAGGRTLYLPPEKFTLSDDGTLAAAKPKGEPPLVFFVK